MSREPYNLAALEAALAGTVFAGHFNFAPVTGSTNTDALEAARTGAPHGSVWLANQQLAGRGRGAHTWHSAAGEGLYVSVLLRPPIPAAQFPLIPLAAGLASAQAIQAVTGLKPDIRWPNDLLIGPRKTGGILAEARASSEGPSHAVVVGIGINVHQRTFDPALSTPATSLDLETKTVNSRQTLLIELLKSLERESVALQHPDAATSIPARIEAASTWIRNRAVHVHGPQACTGITAGLDPSGFLFVQTPTGQVTVQTGGIRDAETAA